MIHLQSDYLLHRRDVTSQGALVRGVTGHAYSAYHMTCCFVRLGLLQLFYTHTAA